MGIPVKLQAFEGPLDLLLHLIDKNKINIYDIPIVEITSQYLSYIGQMQEQNLDVMSEFLVMAATLIEIKSKMLLPAEVDSEGKEEDPRAELVEKLLEYKMYKFMSYELRDQEADASGAMYRKARIPEEVKAYREPVKLEELLRGVTLTQMHAVFKDILKRQENRIDPIRSKFGKIEKDEVDLGETMAFVEQYIMDRGACTFRSLLMLRKGKMYVVVTFLTILELMKLGKIRIQQDGIFAEIFITAQDRSEWNLEAIEEMEEAAEEVKVTEDAERKMEAEATEDAERKKEAEAAEDAERKKTAEAIKIEKQAENGS